MALGAKHWAENQDHRHAQPYNPILERYESYEQIGCYVQFIARHEGEIVGHCGCYVVPSMHTQSLIATEDAWYLTPEHRLGWTAVRFFKFMEKELIRRGVAEITLTTPYGLKSGRICEFLKYKPIATVYSKQIDSR